MISEGKEFCDRVMRLSQNECDKVREEMALCQLVDLFACAMKEKLIACIGKNDLGSWECSDDFTTTDIKRKMQEQLENVTPSDIDSVDVANFALFLWNRTAGNTNTVHDTAPDDE